MNSFQEYNDILYIYLVRYRDGRMGEGSGLQNSYFHNVRSMFALAVLALFKSNEDSHVTNATLSFKIWLFTLSINNYNSLEFLKDHFKNSSMFITLLSSISRNEKLGEHIKNITDRRQAIMSILSFAYVYLKILIQSDQKHRTFYFKYPHLVFIALLSKNISSSYIRKYSPKLIVFANDINIPARTLNLEAQKYGIPTVYLQHAAINSSFPKLNFTLALLEGKYSLDSYSYDESSLIAIIGQPKFDKYKKFRKKPKEVETIGIAFNTIDDLNKVKDLVSFCLMQNFQVIIRPHPRELREVDFDNTCHIVFSPADESSFEFLLKIDVLIASDSSIHLESTMLNVRSIYYNMNSGYVFDHYNFVASGMIKHAKRKEDLITLIFSFNEELHNCIYQKARYYCESLELNESASEKAILFIEELLTTSQRTMPDTF